MKLTVCRIFNNHSILFHVYVGYFDTVAIRIRLAVFFYIYGKLFLKSLPGPYLEFSFVCLIILSIQCSMSQSCQVEHVKFLES